MFIDISESTECLFIYRTRAQSVKPSHYLSKLQSLDIPTECHVFSEQTQIHYNLNDEQWDRANRTTQILWSILQYHIDQPTETNLHHVHSENDNPDNNRKLVSNLILW